MIRSAATLAALAAAVLLFAACSNGDDGDHAGATPSPSLSASPSAQSTPGGASARDCTPARPHAAGSSDATLMSGGIERRYILHVPPQYDGTRPLPVVLNFHGYGSTAARQAPYSRFPALADEQGFIVVTPDATGAPAQQWNILRMPDRADDVAFVGELLDELAVTLCIEATRVFAAGISNGSAFAQRLACALPDRIDAVAAVAATINPSNCPADARVPLIAFHGTEDACLPFEGGRSGCGPVSLPVPAARTAAANWASHDGCGPVSFTQLTEHVDVAAYSECDEEVAVVLYVVDGGGHTWPGAIDVPRLGATTHEIDATALIWEFFVGQGNIR